MDNIFSSLPKLFVDIMQIKWMKSHIQIVDQLSKANVWSKQKQQMELMYNSREDVMNILSYVDFEKLCHVIKYFPQLNQKLV